MQLVNKISRSQLKRAELETVIKRYSQWSEWIMNKACFLTDQEIVAITFFRKHGSHKAGAEELQISSSRVGYIYDRAVRRLQNESLYKRYHDWVTDRMLLDAGINKYKDYRDEFLNQPIYYHRFSTRMGCTLHGAGETLLDVLTNYSRKELLSIRNFGKKSLEELQRRLMENNCIDLLK